MAETQSLRDQLLRWLLVLLIPLLAVGAVNSYFRAYHFSNLAYDRSLFRAALALADEVVVIKGQVVVDLPTKALELLEYDKDDWIYYRVTDPKGRTVAGDAELKLPSTLPKPGGHIYYDTDFGDKMLSVVAFSLPLEGTSAKGVAIIQVAETRAKRDALATEILTAMMLPQLVIVLLAAVLVHYGVERGLIPLERLRHAVAQRSHRDLSPIALHDAPSEVHPLLIEMNELLQRLRSGIDQQQRFSADASHQLRTPLAGLQTQAEMALRERDPEKIHQALEWISSSSLRLSHLVNQLLTLARVEPSAVQPASMQQKINLGELAQATTADWVTAALERKIDIGFEAPTSACFIWGNEVMLKEMLGNLLDNAIRYSTLMGKITVSVARISDQVLLTVEDNGSGIPESERERVFDRFYRLPDSRSDGCGLGLAIVKEIVQAHYANITIDSGSYNRGTKFVVTFKSA